ncbi:hypothetical protein F511_12325 [Dorcoceras hygrometricum]|uniref:Uncharacterized protein n=1 Tax=Dorcoceras hygrometricum TaxID=472368 RepID=A0A2Z7BI30_9LAMI|nr:hypothetical protein F511_12325 [Dorcoceras hygrometricum]
MQMLCKGSRLQPKAGSQKTSTTAQQQDLIRNNQFVATGILSTWELPTHLQYTIPDANNQLHLLLVTQEMWELSTPLIAANKPSKEIEVRELPDHPPRYMGTTLSSLNIASWYSQFNRTGIASKTGLDSNMRLYTSSHPYLKSLGNNYYKQIVTMTHIHHLLNGNTTTSQRPKHRKATTGSYNSTSADPTSLTQQKAQSKLKVRSFTYPNKPGEKSNAYANRLHKGDVFAHLTSFKKMFENNIQTKRLSKRSPTLPLSLSTELSTTDNRRR